MNPSEILEKVAFKYKNCKSYQDCGTVTSERAEKVRLLEFRTAFVRPDKVLFAWQTLDPSAIAETQSNKLWCDGEEIHVERGFLGKPEKHEHLIHALITASAMDEGASLEVPLALLERSALQITYPVKATSNLKHLFDLEEIHLDDDDDEILGIKCFALSGSLFRKEDTKLWVSKHDLEIRQILKQGTIKAAEFSKTADLMKDFNKDDVDKLLNYLLKSSGVDNLNDLRKEMIGSRFGNPEQSYDDLSVPQLSELIFETFQKMESMEMPTVQYSKCITYNDVSFDKTLDAKLFSH